MGVYRSRNSQVWHRDEAAADAARRILDSHVPDPETHLWWSPRAGAVPVGERGGEPPDRPGSTGTATRSAASAGRLARLVRATATAHASAGTTADVRLDGRNMRAHHRVARLGDVMTARPTVPFGIGDVVKVAEQHYCYGLGTLTLRIVEVGRRERHSDGLWIRLRGVELGHPSGSRQRRVLARLEAILWGPAGGCPGRSRAGPSQLAVRRVRRALALPGPTRPTTQRVRGRSHHPRHLPRPATGRRAVGPTPSAGQRPARALPRAG